MLFFLGFLITLFLDQTSKFLMWNGGPAGQAARVHGGSVLNTGISFGIAAQYSNWMWVVALLALLLTLGFGLRPFWQKRPLLAGIFFGAAISNILDRMVYGGVRDWMWLPMANLKNNLADWAICGVVVWCGWIALKKDVWPKEKSK